MTSRLPLGVLAGACGLAISYLMRLLVQVAHLVLLIYQLARGSWDNVTSSIMIVTVLAVATCLGLLFLHPSEERSELEKARIHFASALIQSAAMTGLLVGYTMARPRLYLIIVHSVSLALSYVMLGQNSVRYHKLRLAPPESSLHIPFNALITGDMDRIRAARPDYSKKSRHANKKTSSGKENLEGKDSAVAGKEDPVQAAVAQPHKLALTSEGDMLVGNSGGDERRWFEKW